MCMKKASAAPWPPAMSSSLAFFASAASSFQPAPYTPSAHASSSRPPTRNHTRNDSLAVPPLGMDPQPSDPGVLFIHPPFATFPNSDKYPDGLSYTVLAENTQWFLDARDFVTAPDAPSANQIPYPPHLEPPRGWCPAKKKDLRDRGPEGWPEGEEPRLRCTFCRRTYAGVNAKSMWRRHVFEKHKIAMSNRRDGNVDRPRGRGSGSTYSSALIDSSSINIVPEENRQASKSRDEPHDSLVTMVVAPQTAPEIISSKSRFRTTKPVLQPSKRGRDREIKKDKDEYLPTPVPSQPSQPEHSEQSDSESETEPPALVTTVSPPLTPHADTSSDPPNVFHPSSDALAPKSPPFLPTVIPESPYNPLQTPSFRHSPPRLPSEQPWRFPSPSHPLHLNTRDISLTMVALPLASPVKGFTASSSLTMLALNSSPASSPLRVLSQSLGFETPARSKSSITKLTKKPQFMKSQMSSPLSSATSQYHGAKQRLSGSSPFKKPIGTPHKRQSSEYSDSWFADSTLASTSGSTLTKPSSEDIFSVYESWPAIYGNHSPILRSGPLPPLDGLGFGLLEPFGFNEGNEFDTDFSSLSSELEEPYLKGKRSALNVEISTDVTPPLKKRRMSHETPNTT